MWLQQVVEVSVDHFGDNFYDSDVLREMSNGVDVNVNTVFLGVLPELGSRVLFFVVRDELCRVLSVLLGVEDREIDLAVKSGTWVFF